MNADGENGNGQDWRRGVRDQGRGVRFERVRNGREIAATRGGSLGVWEEMQNGGTCSEAKELATFPFQNVPFQNPLGGGHEIVCSPNKLRYWAIHVRWNDK